MSGDRGLAAIHAAANSSTSAAAIERGSVVRPAAAAAAAEPAADAAGEMKAGKPLDLVTPARTEGNAEGLKEGAAAERARIKAIVSSEKAKGREQLAQSLAFNTNLSAEEAITVLGDAPEAQKGSRLGGLVPQPKVDAQEAADGQTAPAKAGLAAAVQKRIEKAKARAH